MNGNARGFGQVLGVITARGGSKGLPGKNLKLLAGKPLLAYTVEAAQNSGVFDRLIVSTDDAEIAEVARELKAEVPFVRPAALARDDTPHLPVMQHAVEWLIANDGYRPGVVMILQPTSPLRGPEHIVEALELLSRSGADSVLSVSEVPAHMHPLRMLQVDAEGRATLFATGDPVRKRINRRQDLPAAWVMNGAVYAFRSQVLTGRVPSLYGESTVAFRMSPPSDLSIDTLEDWHEVERAIATRHGS